MGPTFLHTSAPTFEPFFLPSAGSSIYGLYLPPRGNRSLRGALLWLPPFAEEANCARRHIVAAARECQDLGYASLLIDPFGTGESDGEFAQANWEVWRTNVVDAAIWLRERLSVPLWLAGVRSGALLAASVASEVTAKAASKDALAGLLFWQPVSSGRAVLDAFLRMKLISAWASADGENATDILGDLRAQLARGEPVEVSGYELSAPMANALAGSALSWAKVSCGRVACVEFRTRIDDPLLSQHTPAVKQLCDGFRALNIGVSSAVCQAPPFWLAHEASLTPGLGIKTITALEASDNA